MYVYSICTGRVPRLITTSAGTNPIHNKKPKKKQVDEDDDDKAFKAKQQAGTTILYCHALRRLLILSRQEGTGRTRKSRRWEERASEHRNTRNQEVGQEMKVEAEDA